MKHKALPLLAACLALTACMSSADRLARERDRDPRYQYNMGLFFLNNNQVDEAIQHFKKALSINPEYSLALNAMGQAYWMTGRLQDSVVHFKRCLEINPALTEAHNNLGISYQELGEFALAEQEFKKVIADPAYKSKELAYYNLARLYFTQDRYEDARFYVGKALGENSTFVMGLSLKGDLDVKEEKLAEAIEAYQEALRIAEDDLQLQFKLAVAYFLNADIWKAQEIFLTLSSRATDPEMKKSVDEYLAKIRIG